MSRIEELNLRVCWGLGIDDVEKLLNEIVDLTAKMDRLKATISNARDALIRSDSRRRDPLVRDALDWLSDFVDKPATPDAKGT